jgi:hypothetical protein
MTVAAESPRESRGSEPGVTVAPLASATATKTTSIFSLAVVALVALAVSAWGGIVPFVGPTFGFSADGSGSWHWNLNHAVLSLAPGALGVATGRARVLLVLAGTLAAAAGAWFVIGPWAMLVLHTSSTYYLAAPGSRIRVLAHQVGYSLGTGLIITACGAFALGWAARHRRTAPEVAAATAATVATVLPTRGDHVKPGTSEAVLVVPASDALIVTTTAPAAPTERRQEPGGWLSPATG